MADEERVLVVDVGSTSFGTVKYNDKDMERIVKNGLPLMFHTDDACEMQLRVEKVVDEKTRQRSEVMVWGFMAICLSRDTDAVHTTGKSVNYWYYLDPVKGDVKFAREVMRKGREAVQGIKASMATEELKKKSNIVALPQRGPIVGPGGAPLK